MSIKSTFGIKRDVAIQVLLSELYKISDEELALLLENLYQSETRNYIIDGLGWSGREDTQINTVAEFYEKGV
jgi:hypothetical protein